MRHFLNTPDWSRPEIDALLDGARSMRESPIGRQLQDKTVALVFLNNSLRTRTSFEVGTAQLGGRAIVLTPAGGMWPLEFAEGAVMLGEAEEHVKEAAKVLSRYCDLIGIRAFPRFDDWSEDREDPVLSAFARHSEVPVMNLETITHPFQELAHVMALQDRLGELGGRKYVLAWSYHPKPLNTAVANSALLVASRFGMDMTLLCPTEEYLLDDRYMSYARSEAEANGGGLSISHDPNEAYHGAHVVYAKSWGALPYFGRWDEEKEIRERYRDFIVDADRMAKTDGAVVSHCLPMRRNVIMTDEVFDGDSCLAYDEAENRLHVQKAVMARLAGES